MELKPTEDQEDLLQDVHSQAGGEDDTGEAQVLAELKELRERNHMLSEQLKASENRRKELWSIHCRQMIQRDDQIAQKEAEVETLAKRLQELLDQANPRRPTLTRSVMPPIQELHRESRATSVVTTLNTEETRRFPRRGKAPPVDPFTSENTDLI